MDKIFFVGFGGFIGAAMRYLISNHMAKWFDCSIPIGTLAVNVLGGVLIGLVMELSIQTQWIPSNLRLFLTTGLMGGLTTFSTFSYEVVSLMGSGQYVSGISHLLLNVVLSLTGVMIGASTGAFIYQ